MAPEKFGGIGKMIRIAENFVAQSKEDDRRYLSIVTQYVVHRRIDPRPAEAFVVLKARNHQQSQPARELDLPGRNAQRRIVEIIDLRAHLDDPRTARTQHADARGEVQAQLRNVALIIRG